jgi:acyl-CoA thioester hydrolase
LIHPQTGNAPQFRLPAAYVGKHRVTLPEIDAYDHVNNTIYLQWLDRTAWAHSAALGLSIEDCLKLRRGMAVRHTRVDYWDAARCGDEVIIATWIVASDERLRCTRRFEIVRSADGKRMLDAEIDFFCMNLDTGKPCRFPREFIECYKPLPEVLNAYGALPDALRHPGQWR